MKRGTTLVELLIYMVIFTVASILVVGSMVQMTQIFGKARYERKVALAADTALERVVREFRLATVVTAFDPASPSTITLNTYQSYTNPVDGQFASRQISLSSGKVVMSTDGGAAGDLTPADVTITELTFTRMDVGGRQLVRVFMRAESGSGRYLTQRSYSAAAILRGSY